MNISSLSSGLGADLRQPRHADLDSRSAHAGNQEHSSRLGRFADAEQLMARAVDRTSLVDQVGRDLSLSASATAASVSYSQQREFELELMTRDGDKVRLRVFAAQDGSLSVAQSQVQTDGYSEERYAQRAEQSSRSSLQFSVEGELDQDELAAINDLLGQVNKVADEFFNGDPLRSFEGLQELGFDTAEIAGFSLEMEQRAEVEVRYSEASLQQYRDVAGEQGHRPGLGLGRYIAELGGAYDRASMLQQIPQQLGQLLNEVLRPATESEQDAETEPRGSLFERVQQMNAELLGWLEQQAAFGLSAESDA
ncbi:MAG TPA: hypothetical protein VIS52_05920 [Motiliproteus sp.]